MSAPMSTTPVGDSSTAAEADQVVVTATDPREIARQLVPDPVQYEAFCNIVEHESSWNVTATNPSSGAYGLMQALPGSKMATHGDDWRTNPETQLRWGLDYMNERYGSPVAAWQFWQLNGWY
ncbi:aggregation-promoting factor C-terminal-like domain-containing protein [Allostreptomyces psammosilenae]